MRYIELNPVRAGITNDPAGYPWSSYHCNMLGQTDGLVVPHPDYLSLGATDKSRQEAYRGLLNYQLSEKCITDIRETTNKSWILGNDNFKHLIQEPLSRRVEPAARGRNRKSEKYKAHIVKELKKSKS